MFSPTNSMYLPTNSRKRGISIISQDPKSPFFRQKQQPPVARPSKRPRLGGVGPNRLHLRILVPRLPRETVGVSSPSHLDAAVLSASPLLEVHDVFLAMHADYTTPPQLPASSKAPAEGDEEMATVIHLLPYDADGDGHEESVATCRVEVPYAALEAFLRDDGTDDDDRQPNWILQGDGVSKGADMNWTQLANVPTTIDGGSGSFDERVCAPGLHVDDVQGLSWEEALQEEGLEEKKPKVIPARNRNGRNLPPVSSDKAALDAVYREEVKWLASIVKAVGWVLCILVAGRVVFLLWLHKSGRH